MPNVLPPRSLSRRRGAACFLILAGLPALAAGGCGGEPADSLDAPEAAVELPPPGTSEVSGQLAVRPGAATAIVTLDPHGPLDVPLPAEPGEMDQYARSFVPTLVVVREGQAVRFINSENELHNVNVVDESGETLFNVGMPIQGGTYDHLFERAGSYRVRCNVHQEMAATVRVTASPFIAIADREGAFAIAGVPYGAYELVVRRGAERIEREITVDGPHTDLGGIE